MSTADAVGGCVVTARLLVTFEHVHDRDAFENHYLEVHVPLTRRLPGLQRLTLSWEPTVIRGDGYALVAELDWESMTDLDRRLGRHATVVGPGSRRRPAGAHPGSL